VRAFIALPMESIGRELFEQSQRLQQTLINEALNWTLAHNYHLTLCFLGDIQTKHIEQLDRIVQSVAHSCSPTTIELAAINWFPNTMKPRRWRSRHQPIANSSIFTHSYVVI